MYAHYKIPAIVILLLTLFGCGQNGEDGTDSAGRRNAVIIADPQVKIDLDEIKERGTLTALTEYSVNSYFIYKGQPLGFEYELLTLLAKHLEIELNIVVINDLDEIFNALNRGKGDLIAHNLTITNRRKKWVQFTDYLNIIRQVLVQRLPDNWRKMKRHEINRQLISNPIQLIGKTIYVRKGSSYYSRLKNLSDEIGGNIRIIEAPGEFSTEDLIRQVSEKVIDYTVADENIAMINQAYYDNIDIRTAISLPQRIAWAVRKNSPELKQAIDEWLKGIKREPTFNVLYNKYYKNKHYFRQRIDSEFSSVSGDKISPYDDIIKKHAKRLNWDWRILASQIYQESQFNPNAKSWIGAVGLMQLLPETAKQFGAKNLRDPDQNIKAGTNFLKWLGEYWRDIPDSLERMKFILASYNTGQGHVQDARRLAEKYGKDPNVWEGNVAEFLLRKSKEKYYTDDVVEFGYCRGEEPVNYVKEIFERYAQYKQFIDP